MKGFLGSCLCVCSVMSNSLRPHGLQSVRLLCPRIVQANILEWVAISYSRGSFQPRDRTWVFCLSCIGGWILYHWATWEAPLRISGDIIKPSHGYGAPSLQLHGTESSTNLNAPESDSSPEPPAESSGWPTAWDWSRETSDLTQTFDLQNCDNKYMLF